MGGDGPEMGRAAGGGGDLDRTLRVPFWLQRSAAWAWRFAVVALAVGILAWIVARLRVVMVPVLVALMLAALLSPVVGRLTRLGVRRLLATWMVLLGVLAILGATFGLVAWALTSELNDGDRWDQVVADTRDWLRDGPAGLSEATIDDLEERLRQSALNGVRSVGTDRAGVVLEVVSGTLLAVALTFFFVKDGEEMWRWLIGRVHPDRRHLLDAVGRASASTLAGYLRAVAITGVIDAVVIGAGLWLIGVPLVVPLAIVTLFAAFLPIIGATLAGALAALVALVTNGPGDALLVALLTLVVQQVEGDVIMPVVMGRQVPLHPAAVLAALAAGGALAGVVGAFVAVPMAAVITAALSEAREEAGGAQLPSSTDQ